MSELSPQARHILQRAALGEPVTARWQEWPAETEACGVYGETCWEATVGDMPVTGDALKRFHNLLRMGLLGEVDRRPEPPYVIRVYAPTVAGRKAAHTGRAA